MPTEIRSAFMLVRRQADLERAKEDLSAYRSILRRRSPVHDFATLKGIWIDEEGVANLPAALVLPDADSARRTVRIPEATGINGIWMLCWLDALASTVSRDDLVAALLVCFGHDETAKFTARFLPIVAGSAPDSNASAELKMLDARYPGLVLPPMHQDASGDLIMPSADPRHEGMRA